MFLHVFVDIVFFLSFALFQKVVQAHGALGCSSSGLESNFSVFKRLMGEQRLNGSEMHETNLLHMFFMPDKMEDDICTRAQTVWRKLYPDSRVRIKARFDKGIKKKVEEAEPEIDPNDDSKVCATAFLKPCALISFLFSVWSNVLPVRFYFIKTCNQLNGLQLSFNRCSNTFRNTFLKYLLNLLVEATFKLSL